MGKSSNGGGQRTAGMGRRARTPTAPSRKTKAQLGLQAWLSIARRGKRPTPMVELVVSGAVHLV